MNKKLYTILLLAAVGLFAGYNVYQNQKPEVTLSELALANVEALASSENPLCPNGCVTTDFPEGCYCNGWHPLLNEYNWHR